MSTQISKIDKKGRVELPKDMRDAFGFLPETDVIIELTDDGIFIKSKLVLTPITKRISEMGLPVTDWSQMKQEIEEGHLK